MNLVRHTNHRFINQGILFLTIWTIVLSLPRLSLGEEKDPKIQEGCTFTKEYITTLEFLRHKKALAIPEKQARQLALKVSQGCNGAAERFIKITSVLSQSDVSANNSIQTGLEFSTKTSTEADTFIHVFLKGYLENYLDMDARSSLKLARSLTTEFQGDTQKVREDFEKMVQFCIRKQDLDMPRPQCGTFAARIAKLGQTYGGNVAQSFIKTFQFLRSTDGPELVTHQALKLAEQIIEKGQKSPENFIQAYKYGVSSKGLASSTQEAIQFAKQMAFNTASESSKSE